MSGANTIHGDCRETLLTLPERTFHCCVTSPPYFGLRSYLPEGHPDKAREVGSEQTPDEFVESMRQVGRVVWHALRDDGVAWLNLGDSYANDGKWGGHSGGKHDYGNGGLVHQPIGRMKKYTGLKPKDLVGVPWRVAFALQADGWFLRDAIIWHKPSPMPGSQRDRCTSSYEFIFQLTKKARYFFDLDAIADPLKESSVGRLGQDLEMQAGSERANGGAKTNGAMKAVCFGGAKGGGEHGSADRLYSGNEWEPAGSAAPRNVWELEWTEADLPVLLAYMNQRQDGNVWTMANGGYKGAHFATFPVALPIKCIKASTSAKGCCPDCGASWERITERTKLRRERPNELTKRTGAEGTGNHCANTVAGVEARTLGWQPTCDCGRDDVVPCRVLDPFHGAGTTAIACRRLGVHYVGCELNADYIAQSKLRMDREANRGSTIKPVKALPGQTELFA